MIVICLRTAWMCLAQLEATASQFTNATDALTATAEMLTWVAGQCKTWHHTRRPPNLLLPIPLLCLVSACCLLLCCLLPVLLLCWICCSSSCCPCRACRACFRLCRACCARLLQRHHSWEARVPYHLQRDDDCSQRMGRMGTYDQTWIQSEELDKQGQLCS